MIITSNEIVVDSNKKELQSFLIDCTNYEQLLPQDKISNFKATMTECSFKVQGGITIKLIQFGFDETGDVLLKSGEESPFPFTLKINLLEEASATRGNIKFDGELSPFIAMVASKPLENLFNFMAEKIVDRFKIKK
jgi:carbon monoxide dehydrogenase subunit G